MVCYLVVNLLQIFYDNFQTLYINLTFCSSFQSFSTFNSVKMQPLKKTICLVLPQRNTELTNKGLGHDGGMANDICIVSNYNLCK